MKVLITNHFPLVGSGSGTYTSNVARELSRLGHRVITITPDHGPRCDPEFENRSIVFSNGKNAEFDLPFNFPCFTTHPVSSNTYASMNDEEIEAYADAYRRFITSAVRDFHPDIIHAGHLWVATDCARESGVPYVATCHGTDLMGYRDDPRFRPCADRAAKGARRIISISRQVTESILATVKVPAEKIALVLNGFSQDVFRPMEVEREQVLRSFGIDHAPRHLLAFAGKFTEFKGLDVLLDAAAIYERELGDVATVICGFGALEAELQEQAKRLGLRGIRFAGHRSQQELALLYNAADLLAMPSRREPFGLVAIEALACGCPVVTTDEGGFRDFITDDVGGMVPVGDAKALAERLVQEIRGGARKKKGTYAARYAAEGYSWSVKVKQMLAVYEEALGA